MRCETLIDIDFTARQLPIPRSILAALVPSGNPFLSTTSAIAGGIARTIATKLGAASTPALAIWPVFLIAAVTLGVLREGLIAPALGEHAAHVIGTLLFAFVMLGIQGLFVVRIGTSATPKDLWLIGLIWMVMTICFEFGFFHFVEGVSWDKLLADYNIFAGRLWVLVLLTTLCGPRLILVLVTKIRE